MSDGSAAAINQINRNLSHLSGQINSGFDEVHAHVGQLSDDITSTQQELLQLRKTFDDYVLQAERTANIQRSETKLSGLKDDIDREFGHHNVVRRTSIGTLQAFDVGNVSNAVVSQISEELMIQTPRYWLAPALVALAAWSRDDEKTAKISLEEATRRDTRKTALFFALVLRRQGRMEGALRWLRHYFQGLDPMNLSREFVVVLECVNVGAFGPAGVQFAAEKVGEWNKQLLSDPAVVDEQTESWAKFMGTHRQEIANNEFPTFRAVSPTWSTIKQLLESASALPVAADWFESVRDAVETRSGRAADILDDILENLVTEYDEDELPLRREILFHESVLEENGSLDRARQRTDALQSSSDETMDMAALQTGAATQPEVWGVGPSTQRASIGASHAEAVAGIGRYTMAYRQNVPADAEINLDANHSGYASSYGFRGWTCRTSDAESAAIQSLTSAWNSTVQAARERLTFKPKTMTIPIVIAAVVTLIFLLIPPHWIMVIPLVIGGGIVAFMWWSKKTKADAAVADLEANKQKALDESIRILRAANAEYIDAGQLYSELDAQEADLLGILNAWPVGHGGTAVTKG